MNENYDTDEFIDDEICRGCGENVVDCICDEYNVRMEEFDFFEGEYDQ